ncbi:family 16 glycosylhydrolase [Lewinella sp. W8]|uniref:family 16 glycosylhydrolase n=1 Tax=Lewinella sp. W8 TaxID=2528208 RepID=UPI00106728FA|nr:family 16 glycosylhydrolase [Lewinella sp. W8]MTB53314.1 family 16 glycosylhydrolase [Lewinella sp. W8]
MLRAPLLFMALCGIFSLHLKSQCGPSLVWSDEFDGTSLNTLDWNYQVGDGCDRGICGWGNNEVQWYQQQNVSVSDGTLKITARRESVANSTYTSGRITTEDKNDFRYGYYEARIKLPEAGGTWPAFWMLPTDYVYGGWPTSGEIDIMEFVANDPREVFGTIHYGLPFPNNSFQGNELEIGEGNWYDDFHTFAIEWREDEIKWFVDDILYSTKVPSDVSPARWPFDQDFHFLLNVAVGGTLGGAVTASSFPTTMEVDYVRVYDRGKTYISGENIVSGGATTVRYVLGNVPDGASINWAVPASATITSGQGTDQITVDWGNAGGRVAATVSADCGDYAVGMDVTVSAFSRVASFENFDDSPLATFGTASGTLREVDNPAPNALNGSQLVGRYTRNANSQFDFIVYNVNSLGDADEFYLGERRIFIDVYTEEAPVGTEILLQMENSTATGDNYPTGRHSRYRAYTEAQGEWHRLEFEPLDRPDGGVSGFGINKFVLLFQPNSTSSNVFYYDNFDAYERQIVSVREPAALDFPAVIMPNPVRGEGAIRIAPERSVRLDLDILDSRGRVVVHRSGIQVAAGERTMDLGVGHLPGGVYFVRLRDNRGRSATRRLIRIE